MNEWINVMLVTEPLLRRPYNSCKAVFNFRRKRSDSRNYWPRRRQRRKSGLRDWLKPAELWSWSESRKESLKRKGRDKLLLKGLFIITWSLWNVVSSGKWSNFCFTYLCFRERLEREKALALQRELERAAREKERRELEEKRKALEEKRKMVK